MQSKMQCSSVVWHDGAYGHTPSLRLVILIIFRTDYKVCFHPYPNANEVACTASKAKSKVAPKYNPFKARSPQPWWNYLYWQNAFKNRNVCSVSNERVFILECLVSLRDSSMSPAATFSSDTSGWRRDYNEVTSLIDLGDNGQPCFWKQ